MSIFSTTDLTLMRTTLLLLISLWSLLGNEANAQQILASDTIPARLNYFISEGGTVKFDSELRELRQVAGAPTPFYSYYWEFGDGNFSFLQKPTHTYTDSGLYRPRLYATNNYDDGNPPPTRPGSLKIKSKPTVRTLIAQQNHPDFFKDKHSISLKPNRMPRPQEEMVVIVGYKNNIGNSPLAKSGTIALFYNDKEFEKDNFKVADIRLHHNETKTNIDQLLQIGALNNKNYNYYADRGPNNNSVSSSTASKLIQEQKALFRNSEAWKYNNLSTDEERFLFISLQTTPEMIKDTNAVVNLSAMLIPDDPLADIDIFKLELQIVASHDPNKMIVKNKWMNYRFLSKQKVLTYKVKFQNTGKGPAKLVNIGVDIPDALDLSTLKIIDSSPKVILCDSAYSGQSCLDTVKKKDSINFVFRNIYLPGVQQQGVNDKDSTKGFIEYQIRFKEKPKKLPFSSSAAIIFDKNEPIYTNKAKGTFRPGISPGIIVGYGFEAGSSQAAKGYGDKNYTIGFSISPYSPFRKYLQAEVFLNNYNYSNDFLSTTGKISRDTALTDNGRYASITHRDYYQETKKFNMDLVPVHLRYNFNDYIGIGAGAFTSITLYEKSKKIQRTYMNIVEAKESPIFVDERYIGEESKGFSLLSASGFIDLQFGLVRKGPAIGIRYLQGITHKDQRIFTYLSFKL